MTQNASRHAVIVWVAIVLIAPLRTGWSAEHPSLVDPASTNCTTCHGAVLDSAVQHPAAASDCRVCHEFSKKDDKTIVQLSAKPTDLCLTCHSDKSKAASAALAVPHVPVTDACTNCHNPHSSANEHLLNSAVPALCVGCHAADALDSSHKVAVSSANCLACHDPHGSETRGMLISGKQHPPFAERSCTACHRQGTIARAKPNTATVCFACHTKQTFEAKHVHTAVLRAECVGCHDPHLARQAKLIRKEGAALCIGCHAAVKAKISEAVVHPPAREDCTTCHDPHKSDQPLQLNDSVPSLCITCHDASDQALIKKHLGADLTKTNCVSCHDPHGSKEKSLLAEGSLHPPFAERSCKTCHQGSATKLVENGSRQLCFACHGEIRDLIAKAKVAHPAIDVVECTECHSPHASRQQHLVKFAAGGECTGCHADKAAEKGEFAHGAIQVIGCRGCHEPHGGDRPRMLRADPNKICLGCHDPAQRKSIPQKGEVMLLTSLQLQGSVAARVANIPSLTVVDGVVRNHPVSGHRATGVPTADELKHVSTTFKGELNCMSCHDPHKGRSPKHFVGGARSSAELCLRCHQK